MDNLPELPRGWIWVNLKDIAEKISDGSHNPPPKQITGVPMLSAQNVENDNIIFSEFRYISEDDYNKESARTIIEPDDVLLTIVGTIGRSAVVKANTPKFSIQRSVAVIRVKTNPQYLAFVLQSPPIKNFLIKNAKGTAQKGIYLNQLKEVKVPMAPSPEQARIVAKIEQLFSDLDDGIKSLEKAKIELKRYRESVLKAAFEGKLIDTNIAWVNYNVEDLSEKIQYGLTSKSGEGFKGPKYLRITDIQNRAVIWENVPYTEITEDIEKYQLNEGDLVFARTGATVGKSFLIKDCPGSAVFASYLIRIIPNKKLINPNLLWYYFQTPRYWQFISKSQRGIGQPNINGQILAKLSIKIPRAIEDQISLVQKMDSRFSVLDVAEKTIEKSLTESNRLRQSILKKAFEGKLTSQDPKDEPVETLLERIKKERAKLTPQRRRERR